MSFAQHFHNSSKNIFTHPIDQQFDDSSCTNERDYSANESDLSEDDYLNVKFYLDLDEEIEQHSTEESEGADSRKDSLCESFLNMKDIILEERILSINAMKKDMMSILMNKIKILTMNRIASMEKYCARMAATCNMNY